MKKYVPAEMEVVYFDSEELLITATSYDDNVIPEIPDIDGEGGGIFQL